jgi:hypothetical protein
MELSAQQQPTGEEGKRVKAVSQFDAVRKAATRRKQSGGDEDDAFKAIEPELDELFAMDEQLVWLCVNPHDSVSMLNCSKSLIPTR